VLAVAACGRAGFESVERQSARDFGTLVETQDVPLVPVKETLLPSVESCVKQQGEQGADLKAEVAEVAPLTCGVTRIILDGSASKAGTCGTVLRNYQWTVWDPAGMLVFDYIAGPDDTIAGEHVVSGSGKKWLANFAVYDGQSAAKVTIVNPDAKLQFYQSGVKLYEDTTYLLSFSAYAVRPHAISLYMHQHSADYANFGLSISTLELSATWQRYAVRFTTQNIEGVTQDGRLRFWLRPGAQAGDIFWFDRVSLVQESEATNLIANPGFESGKTNWDAQDSGEITWQVVPVEQRVSGEYRVRLLVSDNAGRISTPAYGDIHIAPCN